MLNKGWILLNNLNRTSIPLLKEKRIEKLRNSLECIDKNQFNRIKQRDPGYRGRLAQKFYEEEKIENLTPKDIMQKVISETELEGNIPLAYELYQTFNRNMGNQPKYLRPNSLLQRKLAKDFSKKPQMDLNTEILTNFTTNYKEMIKGINKIILN